VLGPELAADLPADAAEALVLARAAVGAGIAGSAGRLPGRGRVLAGGAQCAVRVPIRPERALAALLVDCCRGAHGGPRSGRREACL